VAVKVVGVGHMRMGMMQRLVVMRVPVFAVYVLVGNFFFTLK